MSLIGPEMGFLSRSAHQRAHLLKEELYDLMDLSLHEDRTRSVAAFESLPLWHLSPIQPTRLIGELCLELCSDTLTGLEVETEE